MVAEGLHTEGCCQDERLETLGQEGVTAVEHQEVHRAREGEEDVDVDDDPVRVRDGGGQTPRQTGGEEGEDYLDSSLPGPGSAGQRGCRRRRRREAGQTVAVVSRLLQPPGHGDSPPSHTEHCEVESRQ